MIAPRPRKGCRREAVAGFTLLEILIGLVIIGLILATLGQALGFGLASWKTQTRLLYAGAWIDPADRAIRRMIADIDPAGSPTQPPLAGTASAVAFASTLPESFGAGGRRVALRLFMAPPGTLSVEWRPAPAATTLLPTPATREPLLAGLSRVEFSYYGASGSGAPSWRGEWNDARPPSLVRVRLIFPPGDRRHWPDIVEAPRMQAPPQ